MIVFTTIGLLWFWLLCYQAGQFLAWIADDEGIVIGTARVLLRISAVETSVHAMTTAMAAKHTAVDVPDGRKHG